MTHSTICALVLLYLLCGQVFAVAYLLAFKPEERTTILGLMIIVWPLVIVFELVLALAKAFGDVARATYEQIAVRSAKKPPEKSKPRAA
jgi:hypothetical protein